jgi:hypothetical protein
VNDKLDPGLRPDVVRALEDAYQAEQFGEVAAIEFESAPTEQEKAEARARVKRTLGE